MYLLGKADMSSADAATPAVQGAHTVFLMTNFWETMSADTEIAQGKAVADACQAAGVKHLIFSSLINTKEASKGKLPNISHFDGKANIEAYIRQSGVPSTFVLPGMFMSQYFETIRKGEDGAYMLALPIDGNKAQIPLFDPAGDTGTYAFRELEDDTIADSCQANSWWRPSRRMHPERESISTPPPTTSHQTV